MQECNFLLVDFAKKSKELKTTSIFCLFFEFEWVEIRHNLNKILWWLISNLYFVLYIRNALNVQQTIFARAD